MVREICNIMDYKLSGSGSYASLHEVLEQAGAGRAGTLGVELDTGEIGALDDRGEGGAMLAAGHGEGVHRRGEAVHKIEARLGFNSIEQADLAAGRDGVPAHVRHR